MKNEPNMKKKFLSFAVVFLMSVGCYAKVVPTDSAAAIASKMLSVKHSELRKIRVAPGHGVKKTRMQSVNDISDALYVFTPDNGNGFVIVAGDDAVRPILAFSPRGRISEELPPAMEDWLLEIAGQIELAREYGARPSAEVASQWRAPSIGNIVNEMETAQWGQHAPFNEDCPYDGSRQCITGCVPTAFAILMRYYEYPTSRKRHIPAYTTETLQIEVDQRRLRDDYYWDEMPLDYNDGYTSRQGKYVASLMADVGAAFQVDYGRSATSGNLSRFELFSIFDFCPGQLEFRNDFSTSEWYAKLKNQLRKSQPICYSGTDENENESHSFILDGYTDRDYFKVNWGWDGDYNGYYALDAMTPGRYEYNSRQWAYFGMVPIVMSSKNVTAGGKTYFDLDGAILNAVPNNGQPTVVTVSGGVYLDDTYIDDNQNVIIRAEPGTSPSIFMAGNITNTGTLKVEGDLLFLNYTEKQDIILNEGNLTFTHGTLSNIPLNEDKSDSRKCIRASKGSHTIISGGWFVSHSNAIYLQGDADISGGNFISYGNSEVLINCNKSGVVAISGGNFTNENEVTIRGDDYRRAIWTDVGTNTKISGGRFASMHQAMCFNGNATIDNAIIKGLKYGYGCCVYSGGVVNIKSCSLSASPNFFKTDESTLLCSGGIYSDYVDNRFIASGFECFSNPEPATQADYPYAVLQSSKLQNLTSESKEQKTYSVAGHLVPSKTKGVNIIRSKDGITRKVLMK